MILLKRNCEHSFRRPRPKLAGSFVRQTSVYTISPTEGLVSPERYVDYDYAAETSCRSGLCTTPSILPKKLNAICAAFEAAPLPSVSIFHRLQREDMGQLARCGLPHRYGKNLPESPVLFGAGFLIRLAGFQYGMRRGNVVLVASSRDNRGRRDTIPPPAGNHRCMVCEWDSLPNFVYSFTCEMRDHSNWKGELASPCQA